MKTFFLEEFGNVQAYKDFIKYMLVHSDSFSLIYFKNKENEKLKKNTKILYDKLKKFRQYTKRTQIWPNTKTYDISHFYKIVYYRSELECMDLLTLTNDIFDWDYPEAPMDLCFYRDGYCCLAITAHEHMAFLYSDNKGEIDELKALGAKLSFWGDETPFHYDSFSDR